MIELRGKLEPADLLSAQRTHFKPGTTSRIVLAVLAAGYVLGFCYSLTVGPPAGRWLTWSFIGGAVYFLFLVALSLLVLLPRRVQRTYRQRKDFQREFTYTITDQGITTTTPDAHQEKPWADVLKWKEGRQNFLLYSSDNLFQLFPKRLFASPTQIDAFRDLLFACFCSYMRISARPTTWLKASPLAGSYTASPTE